VLHTYHTQTILLPQAGELLEQVPLALSMRRVKEVLASRSDPDPMKTVLLQEVERYNKLLTAARYDLTALQRAVQGLIIVTPELESVMEALLAFKVPAAWGFCYPSIKPLGSWIADLAVRIAQLERWAFDSMPKCFWLPGLTYPTGFLTALLQTSARKNGIAIDTLSWEFSVLNLTSAEVPAPAKEGAYCDGLFLEGARWNKLEGCLAEPEPMQLYHEMPVIHFKPVESKKKGLKGVYVCPVYMYPVRTGTRERPSFVIAAELKAGKFSTEFWTKRGVALLLSIAA
jgi:dynein heavy chain, axonemal